MQMMMPPFAVPGRPVFNIGSDLPAMVSAMLMAPDLARRMPKDLTIPRCVSGGGPRSGIFFMIAVPFRIKARTPWVFCESVA